MKPITYYSSKPTDGKILETISEYYGAQLEALSRQQKYGLLLHLTSKLATLDNFLSEPPSLATAVDRLSPDGLLALLEATVAQLRTNKH